MKTQFQEANPYQENKYWQSTLASSSYKNQYVFLFLFHFFVIRGSLIIISHSCSIAMDLPLNIVIEILRQEFQFYSHTYVGTMGWVNDTLWMMSHLPLWKR